MSIKIIKCKWLVPPGMDAFTVGTIIFYRNNISPDLIEHEKTHVNQFKKQPFTFWLKYLFSRKHRCIFEAEAYAAQIKYISKYRAETRQDLIKSFATVLHDRYYLSYSMEYIVDILRRECLK